MRFFAKLLFLYVKLVFLKNNENIIFSQHIRETIVFVFETCVSEKHENVIRSQKISETVVFVSETCASEKKAETRYLFATFPKLLKA